MKRYTFTVVIDEGSDEFWEEALADGKTGCDDVVDMLKRAMGEYGLDADNGQVTLTKYEA